MQSGILLVDKSKGDSSAKALAILKRKLQISKLGHCGTLDPMATGLLVCLIGKATRLASFVEGKNKHYTGELRLGITTSSDDITGDVLTTSDLIPKPEIVLKNSQNFIGVCQQTPPKVSAVKINGERAYKLARAGTEFEIKSKTVTLFDLQVELVSESDYRFSMRCSKGYHVRSFVRDLGESLGCGACLTELRREASEPFAISQAKTLDDIELANLLPWTDIFVDTPKLKLKPDVFSQMLNGNQAALSSVPDFSDQNRVIFCDSAGNPGRLLVKLGGLWTYELNLWEND